MRYLAPLLLAFSILFSITGHAATAASIGEQPGYLSAEFIYEDAPFPACHASTIAETPAGLIAAWFGGTDEKNKDVGIWVARHLDGKWTAPVEVANGVQSSELRYPTWNPVLYQAKGGPLLLFYKVGPDPRNWWGMMTTSADNGQTWSEPKKLPEGILGPVKNKPVRLANGDLLCPTSTEDSHLGFDSWRVHMERTPDLGKTWSKTKPLNTGIDFSAIQPSILIHSDTRLQTLGRSRQGRIWESWSEDAGKSWSPLKATGLPNPNSGTDAVTLADGRHLLIYNHTQFGRSPLNLSVSEDGETWQAALVLEDQPGEYSYPAIIQTADGLVHATYTWKRELVKHVVIDPAKLSLSEITAGKWPKK
ncbi:MAG: exo-alpha-sialidase [Planctomycetes bacterium]|nr:exo-alpha-sialidase [Planctomycetota bacterium]